MMNRPGKILSVIGCIFLFLLGLSLIADDEPTLGIVSIGGGVGLFYMIREKSQGKTSDSGQPDAKPSNQNYSRVTRTEMPVNRKAIERQNIASRKEESRKNGIACCPKCGSTSLTANKKGFGVGKAVVGAAMTGGIGLVAGNINRNKVKITCLNCGYQFKPGEK